MSQTSSKRPSSFMGFVRGCLLALFVTPVLVPGAASAANYTWTIATGSAAGGSGTWNTSNLNWWNGTTAIAWPNGTGASADIASFTAATPSAATVTLAGTLNAAAVYFSTSQAYTLTSGTLSVANSGTIGYQTGRPVIASTVSGSNITLRTTDGNEQWMTLSGSNQLSGTTTITNKARVWASNTAAFGTSTIDCTTSGGLYVNTTGTIGNNILIGFADTPGTNRGPLRFDAAGTLTGTITMTADASITTNAGTVAGTIAGPITESGGSRSLAFGLGSYTLSGVSTYTGSTSLRSGTITMSGGNDRLPTTTTLSLGTIASTAKLTLGGNSQTLAGLINFNSSTSSVVGGNATASSLVLNIASGTNTFSGQVGGAGTNENNLSLRKQGGGTFAMSGTGSFTGATTIEAGVLSIAGTSALQGTSGVTIAGGAGLTYTGGSDTFGKNITVTAGSGTGTIWNSGSGLLTLSGNLSKDNSVLRLTGGQFNVTGTISGTTVNKSDLLVAGTSTVTLSAANTYNGPTFVIESSTLAYGINNAIPSNSVVTLGNATSQGTLNLNGFTGAIGGLAFGAGGGTLRLVATSTSAAPLTASSGTMTLTNGTLDLAGSGSTAGLYRVLSAQSIGGSFTSVTGTSAAYQVITSATSVDYQQRAVLGAVTVTNPAVSIITGGSAAFTYTVANSALSGGASLSFTGANLSNVTGSSSGSVAAAGTSGATSGLFFNGTTVGSGQQGTFTVSAPTAFGATTATGTVSVNVLDHSNAALALASGNNQTIITGGTLGSVTFSLTNAGTGRSALDVGTLSNLSGTTGSAVVASNGSATYTASGFNTTAVGQNKTLAVSLSAGDVQTLSGANAMATYSGTATYTVLDHSNAALVLASGGGQTIITGGSFASVGFNLTNAGSNRAAVQVNSLTNLIGGTGSSVVLSGGTASYTATIADALTIGTGTLSVGMLAGDQQSLSGASGLQSLTSSATYTVLDHATSSLAGTLLTGTTITLGTYNYATDTWDSGGASALFSIFNLASSFGAASTADLSLLSVTGTADGFTTNLASYAAIAGGTSSQFSIFFDPSGLSTSTTKSTTFQIAMSDKTGMSGATNTNTLFVTANVVVVPEPGALALAGIGIAAAGSMLRKRWRPQG